MQARLVNKRVDAGSTTFTFVTGGIERAIVQAKAAAGDKNVGVARANIAQQCLQAGLGSNDQKLGGSGLERLGVQT